MARILVIDDDPEVLAFRKILLGSAGHEVQTLENAENLVEEVRKFGAELVITDIMMPGLAGGGVCESLRKEFGPDLPIIVSSAWRMRIRSPKERDHLLVHFPKTESPEKILDLIQTLLHRTAEPASPTPESETPTPKSATPAPKKETPAPKPQPSSPEPEAPAPKPGTPSPKPLSRNPLFEIPKSKS